MRYPITIKTKSGLSLYETTLKKFNTAKLNDELNAFRKIMFCERMKVCNQLSDFIYDETTQKEHPMDEEDKDGWNFYNEMADRHAVLSYFETRPL